MATSGGRSPLLLLLLTLSVCSCYRLDRPRLLLPYSPTTSVRAELHVSDPEGGCFEWQSSRFQDIEVVPIGSNGQECSDRAEIRTTSKVAGNVSAMVHAIDPKSRTRLSCEVRVDYISTIEILTTTNVIFVDAVPVKMQIQARNSRGAAFSTLGALPFEWSVTEDEAIGDRPIHIVPFSASEWEGKPEVVELEREGKKGHSVLVEGITTGWSTLTAKLAQPFFKTVLPHSLEVVVVANLQLLPSYTLYVPVHTVIPFQVEIIRQQTAHKVSMPSPQYHLRVDDSSICSLDISSSSVTALKKGTTEVVLLSHNIDSKMEGVSPPSTLIHVTEPRKMKWNVNGDNWLLEVGRKYKLYLTLFDSRDNLMYISDEARFETVIPTDHVTITHQSKNGTYFEVVAKKSGSALLKSRFSSIMVNGREMEIIDRVRGEQGIDVVDPIEIFPSQLILPLTVSAKRSEWTMTTKGGSGAMEWRVEDGSIVSIGSSTGIVTCSHLGETTITAVDIRNRAHSAKATVRVVEVNGISFGKTRVESVEGGTLWLNVQLYGLTEKGDRLAITDCRSIDLSVHIEDENVFTLAEKSAVKLPLEGSGCVSIPLSAIQSGDTKVTVELIGSKMSSSQHVSVYPSLTTALLTDRLLLGVGSKYRLEVKGGPRPWIIDSSAAYHKSSVLNGKATSSMHDSLVEITCGRMGGTTEVEVEMGNGETPSNPLPAREKTIVRVCCITPTRVVIQGERHSQPSKNSLIEACPTHTKSLFVSSSMRLSVVGYGRCESEGQELQLDSVSDLTVKWTTDNDKLLRIEKSGRENDEVVIKPKGTAGGVKIHADCGHNLKASTELRLFDKARISQSSLVLWNDPSVKGEVRVEGGSGHFVIKSSTIDPPFHHSLLNGIIKISPRSVGSSLLRIHDQCIDESVLEIRVKVTDIQQIGIDAPEYMEVGRTVEVNLRAVDESGDTFSQDVAHLMQLELTANNQDVSLEKISSNRYSMTALRVGGVSLSATGRSSRTSSDILTSSPHSVQIFSPILLFPKVVTLLSQSTFQLEVVGGPTPTPAISFSLNDSSIASVSSNALIRSSTSFGYSSVTGSIQYGDSLVSKDSVVVRVVKMAGVRIVVSASQVEKGRRILARLEGIDEGQSPFAFGGAKYPLNIKWSLNDTDVFSMISPFGNSYRESCVNKYSVWLYATETGVASLSVSVQHHSQAHEHFSNRANQFHYQVELKSILPLSLSSPDIQTGSVLLTPGGSIQLSSNWPSSQVKYRIRKEDSHLFTLTSSGFLTSKGPQGVGIVEIIREGRIILATVEIVQPTTIDVKVEPELEAAKDSYLTGLPLGSILKLSVVYRDSNGRSIHGQTNGNIVLFRPHRFDLTTIEGRNNNRTLSVRLMKEGETVLKVWDPSSASLSTFIRLKCSDELHPSAQVIVTTDILCMRSPLKESDNNEWKSADSKVVRGLSLSGVFLATSPGTSHIHLSSPSSPHNLHTTIRVVSPSSISFHSSSPSWISNTKSSSFRFPLVIGTNESIDEAATRKKLSAIDCVDSSLSSLAPLDIPFDCSISFTESAQLGSASAIFHAKSYFDPIKGEYGCSISDQSASSSPSLFESSPSDVVVSASWVVDGRHLDNRISLHFYPAFSIIEDEIQLTNYDRESAILTIQVAKHLASDIVVTSCGDAVNVKEVYSIPSDQSKTTHKEGTLKWIRLTLNERSSSLGEECVIKVESVKTGQRVNVPVKITLVGDTARRAYRDLESKGFIDFCIVIFSKFSYLIPNLIVIVAVLIVTILIWRRMISSRTTYGSANPHNLSAFLSDAPSPNTSHGGSFLSRGDLSSSLHAPQFHSTPRDQLRQSSPQSNTIFTNGDAAYQYTRRKAGQF
ncbi:npp-12 [Pristionchus pacificus]|uniref:Npp-12 n=1 Tax=Pristionchus pacificus TaxID=54126 RepID=A0A2A6BMA1_PRIPA|nr:npp-12 [Pristionchus pacificus]|eukprot:PDM66943.1 npp-12 [Pristionchus pacificus]